MSGDKYQRFRKLGYDDFRRMASDPTLSVHERIGFPDEYRGGKEHEILEDLAQKSASFSARGKVVVDVGIGCGALGHAIVAHCGRLGQHLHAVDAPEVLAHFADSPLLSKVNGRFPETPEMLSALEGRVDLVIVYSVFHYVFVEGNVFGFLDAALSLLAPGGELIVGDLPNVSKRKRFLASEAGRRHHREFSGRDEDPPVSFNALEPGGIDDAVVLSLVTRARAAGFDAYVVPQSPSLPMANRREDVVVVRP